MSVTKPRDLYIENIPFVEKKWTSYHLAHKINQCIKNDDLVIEYGGVAFVRIVPLTAFVCTAFVGLKNPSAHEFAVKRYDGMPFDEQKTKWSISYNERKWSKPIKADWIPGTARPPLPEIDYQTPMAKKRKRDETQPSTSTAANDLYLPKYESPDPPQTPTATASANQPDPPIPMVYSRVFEAINPVVIENQRLLQEVEHVQKLADEVPALSLYLNHNLSISGFIREIKKTGNN